MIDRDKHITVSSTNMTGVKKFLTSRYSSYWVKVGSMRVYVRKARHMVGFSMVYTFDIANVENSVAMRGKGQFKQFLIDLTITLESDAELRAGLQGIYIENVLNDRLDASLIKMGLRRLGTEQPYSYYLPLNL